MLTPPTRKPQSSKKTGTARSDRLFGRRGNDTLLGGTGRRATASATLSTAARATTWPLVNGRDAVRGCETVRGR